MAELFADIPEALANSVEIARRCNLTLELGKSKLPPFPTPAGVSLDDYLRSRPRRASHRAWQNSFPDAEQRASRKPEYAARLEFEIKTIPRWVSPATS